MTTKLATKFYSDKHNLTEFISAHPHRHSRLYPMCQLFSSLWWSAEEATALFIGCSWWRKTKHLLYIL